MSNLFFIILHNNLPAHIFIISHKTPFLSRADGRKISLVNTAVPKGKKRPMPKNSPHFSSKRRNNAPGRPKKNERKYRSRPITKIPPQTPAAGEGGRISALFKIPFSPTPCGGGQREQS